MKVSKFIESLKPFIDLSIENETVNNIIDQLKSMPNYVFIPDNFSWYIPNWKDMQSIKISFTWHKNKSVLNVHVDTVTKDEKKNGPTEYEHWGTRDNRFMKKMCKLITSDTVYTKKFVIECFSKQMMDEFKRFDVKLEIGDCEKAK